MPGSTSQRLRAELNKTIEMVAAILRTVRLEPVDKRDFDAFIIVLAPDFTFADLNAHQQAARLEAKRTYDRPAEVMRVLLGQAPSDLLQAWQDADRAVRSWIELQCNDVLTGRLDENERKMRTAFGEVVRVLDVFDQLGDKGIIVVPDTSALIERPEPSAYRSVAGQDEFTLVLLPTVLGELDELKIAHKNQAVRDAANSAISRIKGWRLQGSLVNGVTVDKTITVRAHHVEPDMDSSLSWLDASVQDDRIVAATLAVEAQHPAARVVLVVGDINLLNKADAAMIETADIPSSPGER